MATGPGKVGTAYRYYFALRLGSGAPRTGASGAVSATVRNPGDTASTAPAVTEVSGGQYFIDIPAAFTTSHGAGEYGVLLEVTSPPRDTFAESLVFFVRNVDDLAQPGDEMDLVAGAVDAAAIATNAIDADAIAADAIGATELAVSAVNKIRDAILSDSTPFAGANIDAAISSRSSHSAADVDTALTALHGAGAWTTATGFSTHTPADVDSTLTASHGAGDWTTATGFATPGDAMDLVPDALDSSAVAASGALEIASAVDAVLTATHGVGAWTTGAGGPTVGDIASAVWDKNTSAHVLAGSFGEAANAVARSGLVIAGSTTTVIKTDLTEPNNFFTDMEVVVEGPLGAVARNILSYSSTDGAITVAVLPFTPSAGGKVTVLRRPSTQISAISEAVWSFGTRTLTSLGGLVDSITTAVLSNLRPGETRDSFLSFPDRSGGVEGLDVLFAGEIDMRDEMEAILNRRGHKVFLRRALDQRCPSWREDRREAHPESCPYCWNGWLYRDEMVLTYRRPALGMVAEGLVDTIRTPFGQLTARQTIFYFRHDVAPSTRDGIIFVTLNDAQDPLEPFNIERIWQIQMAEDFRDKLGRIEFWTVMAEQRSIGK